MNIGNPSITKPQVVAGNAVVCTDSPYVKVYIEHWKSGKGITASHAITFAEQMLEYRETIATLTAERDQARKAILEFGNASAFDWAVLGRIDNLEGTNKALEEMLAQVRNQIRPLSDRSDLADTYEQWLLDIGMSVGCQHLDEQLPNCVIRVLQGEDEEKLKLTAERAELVEALKELLEWSPRSPAADVAADLIAKSEGTLRG